MSSVRGLTTSRAKMFGVVLGAEATAGSLPIEAYGLAVAPEAQATFDSLGDCRVTAIPCLECVA